MKKSIDKIINSTAFEYLMPVWGDKRMWDRIKRTDHIEEKKSFFAMNIGTKYAGYTMIGVGVYNLYCLARVVEQLDK